MGVDSPVGGGTTSRVMTCGAWKTPPDHRDIPRRDHSRRPTRTGAPRTGRRPRRLEAIGIDTVRPCLASAAESGERGVSPALAIDLGGTKAAFAVIDSDGAVLARAKRPSHEGGRGGGFDALAASATRDACARPASAGPTCAPPASSCPASTTRDRPGLGPEPLGPRRGPAARRAASRLPVPVVDRQRPLRLRARRAVAGRRARLRPTSSSSPSAPASGPASCRTAASSAAAAGSPGRSAGSPSTRAGRPTTAAVGCFEAEAAGPRARPARRAPLGRGRGRGRPPRRPRRPQAVTRPSSGSPWASPT